MENESATENELLLPIGIFLNEKLSALETITKFLKEEKNLRYSQIARALNRDERTIWCTYNNSLKKMSQRLPSSHSEKSIPLSAISHRRMSVLESITVYLKEELCINYVGIAQMLGRDYRTVWTVYRRSKAKRQNAK